jgi:hypothetical protein
VEAAGAVNALPLLGSFAYQPITTDDGKKLSVTVRRMLPGYFEALGLPPLEGRLPQSSDLSSGRRVAVINQRAAKRLFPEGRASGRVVTLAKEPTEVIGVVPDLKNLGPDDGKMPSSMREPVELFAMYQPAPADRPEPMVVVVRPKAHAAALQERLRQAAKAAGPRAIVERVRLGTEWLDATVVTPRRRTVLLSLLGALGLLLTLIGVSGMTAYAVARRTQEIGVRMAFGATTGDVVRGMVRDATWPIALGIAAGLGGAWAATRLISTFLFQTTPTDAPTFATTAALLAAAALFSRVDSCTPRRHVDPVISLRSE